MRSRGTERETLRKSFHTRVALVVATVALGACILDEVTSPGLDPGSIALAVVGDSVVAAGDSTQLVIQGVAGQDRGPTRVGWRSSDTTVATVDAAGIVRGQRAGEVTITAVVAAPELVTDIETAWPMMVVYRAIAVEPIDSLTGLGESRTLVAYGTDVHGLPRAPVPATFTAVEQGVVTVSEDGVVTARADGVARVVASYADLTDTVPVRVRQVAKSLTFAAPTLALPSLQQDTVVPVLVRDTRDSLIVAPAITWSSSDPTAISVSPSGTIRALRAGQGAVTARVDTAVAQLQVSVAQIGAGLEVVGGDGQALTVGTLVPIPPAVRVRDAAGYPVPGVSVVFSVTGGRGQVADSVQVTNALGIASVTAWTLGTSAGPNLLTATAQSLSVTLTATGVPGPASTATSLLLVSDDTVAAGAPVSLMLQTRDQYGNPLTAGGRSVGFTASGGSATGQISPTTDNGDGTYGATFTGVTAGSATTIRATINGAVVTTPASGVTVIPGPPASLVILAGDNQSVQVGQTVPVAPSVRVRDAQGNVLPGTPVVFAAADGSGSVAGGFQTSDATGRATAIAWTLGPRAGAQQLTAAAGAASIQFVATGMPGPLSMSGTLITVSDDTVSSGSAITLALQTADEYGNPILLTGRTVSFAQGGGTSSGTIAPTSEQGGGRYTALFTGGQAGSATTITATVDGAGVTSPSPRVTVIPGPPASMVRSAGNGQTVPAGTEAPVDPAVLLKDANNNPVPGVTVTFSISAGNGQVTEPVAVSAADGVATVGGWTVGTVADAMNRLVAVGGGHSVQFSATVTAGPASPATSLITVEQDSVEVGRDIRVTLFANDAHGNPLTSGGSTVGFYYEGGTSVGTFQPTDDTGTGQYETRFTGVTAGTWGQIRATLDGVLVTTLPPRMRVWQ